ncbi:MAG: Uma2 family endonuclease [Chloroflexota bacterium]|nr:Uma2 family endonuclease [Chloroflexota bacterium]
MTDSVIAAPVPIESARGADGDVAVRGISFEDYLRLYEGQYAEWFPPDEVRVYVANNLEHQDLLSYLDMLLRLFLRWTKLGKHYIAGVPMKTEVGKPGREPDIMIILNEHLDRLTETYVIGAADIVVEIISLESRGRDLDDKFKEYAQSGVPEYWLFDPDNEAVDLHTLVERDGKRLYVRVQPNAQGRIASRVLPGMILDPLWLDAEKRPEDDAMIKHMAGKQ